MPAKSRPVPPRDPPRSDKKGEEGDTEIRGREEEERIEGRQREGSIGEGAAANPNAGDLEPHTAGTGEGETQDARGKVLRVRLNARLAEGEAWRAKEWDGAPEEELGGLQQGWLRGKEEFWTVDGGV